MHQLHSSRSRILLICSCLLLAPVAASAALQEGVSLDGTFTANAEPVVFSYVYVYAEDEGFYEPSDPTWKILFSQQPVEERDLDEPIWDGSYLKLGITRTSEFGDQPEIQVYSQDIRADSLGNLSGGSYPRVELESTGPERFAGRVYLPEPQEFFGDTVEYDFTFSAPFSDPYAPIGDLLPADGGEPGRAYLAWVEAIHSGDIERLKTMVPAEMAAQLGDDAVQEEIELMKLLTPTEVTILGGSSDGETAVLQVEGVKDGVKAEGEIELTKTGGFWIAQGSSWK